MKASNLAYDRSNLRTRISDDLFTFSIRKIVNDVLLQEMKTGREIKAIAIISSFADDRAGEVANHISYEFADEGNDTLLLSLRKEQYMDDEEKRICELTEEGIMKTHIKRLHFLSMENLTKVQDFTLDKASLIALLDSFKGKYKRIIIDVPPLEEDLAGFISAMAADGIYFICNSKSTRFGEMQKHYANLRSIGANIFGIIYNHAEQRVVRKLYKLNGRNHG